MESVHDIINYKALQNVINENFKDDPINVPYIMASLIDVCHACEIYNPECSLMCDKCPVNMMAIAVRKLENGN